MWAFQDFKVQKGSLVKELTLLAPRDLKVSVVALECQELQDLMAGMASLAGRE